MASSMMSGEKRWASGRRGGMTVLGKVAVPKPLNLPSQRLENHGLDPNVEIVPKGTLSWGGRSSSSASNPWGSSTLSPNAEGGTSPSRLSGRPSSGSGTRPSTAGSDRTHEPTANAWGQNSRPSSASGVLSSNQTAVTSLRPRSAETRPGSSQLSRFAEPSSDNTVAWGPNGVSEKLRLTSSKNDGFSLNSGDFPTLGSEKDNTGKRTDSQDHASYGRPSSSSGEAASGREKIVTSSAGDTSVNANVKIGTVNTWRRDGSQHVEDGVQPTLEKWQVDPPPYLNTNIPPQPFDAWHGHPVNPPPGVWYRGPPGGLPYATPLGPGGFPIEPFPFYRPQIPPAALSNSQPVPPPPPGAGPRGHHPKNGDVYRPHIPEAFIRPGMPIRPGFYPGPMAYEGYYGPPMGYCNSNERDVPFMGMTARPSVYNWYSGENAPDPGDHSRASPHGPTGKSSVPEPAESGHHEDLHRPYKVLLKQHDEWDDKRSEDKWEHAVPAIAPYPGKGDQPRTSLHKNERGLEDRKDEEIYSGRRILVNAPSRNFDKQGSSSESGKVKSTDNRGRAKAGYDSTVDKLENAASTFSQGPQAFPATQKDQMLIQQIEGLNAKARASDGRPDTASIPIKDGQKSRLPVVDAKVIHVMNEAGAVCSEGSHGRENFIPAFSEGDKSRADKTLQPATSSGAAISRRTSHGVQGRLDHRSKRFNTRDAEGLQKKPVATDFTHAVSAANLEPSSSAPVQVHLPSVYSAEQYGISLQGKDGGESLTPMSDPGDCQAQRAKMREIAKQRAIQLQKEEEERIKEQKAKALLKLEELNRRTQAMDVSSQKLETAPPTAPVHQKQEECRIPSEQMVARKSETSDVTLVSIQAQSSGGSTVGIGECAVLSKDTLLERSHDVQSEPLVPHVQLLPFQPENADAATATDNKAAPQDNSASATNRKAAPQVNEGSSTTRSKRMGYKQKQTNPSVKNLAENSFPINLTEAQKDQGYVAVNDVPSAEVVPEVAPSCESSLPMNSDLVAESAHHRKKNNRGMKNKLKTEEVPSIIASPSEVPKEINCENLSCEIEKPRTCEWESGPSPFPSSTDAKQAIKPSEQHPSLPSEEASGKVNNQWKSQHTRRMPRNQQTNRTTEKFHSSDAFIWAPVRSQIKAEVMEEAINKTVPAAAATAKSDNLLHNNLKSKRAEMERYVPKPKELAQQQPVPSSVNQTSSEDTIGRAEPSQNVESYQAFKPAVGNTDSASEPGNVDVKQNKQFKSHGSWRHRGSVESALVQGLRDGSSSPSNPSKNIQKAVEHQSVIDVNLMKEQTKSSDDWNTYDGRKTPENSDVGARVTSVVKDHGVTGRSKRNPSKGHRSMWNNQDHDQKNRDCGDTDKSSSQTPSPEIGQTDKNNAIKESRRVGERTGSHWQPKSHPVHNQRANRPGGGQNVTAEVSNTKKDLPSQDSVQPLMDPSVTDQKNVEESNVVHQESKRESKVGSLRGRPYSPNQTSINPVDMAPPANMDTQNEQRYSSGFRKNGNQNSRSGRGHEYRGDWTSAGQDSRQHNMSSNRERQRHDSNYEYQPIVQYNNNRSNNFEGRTDGSHNRGSRYRERNQGHSMRGGGNFYGRQSGTARGDANYD